jgi:RsiW-degrading membrane proteinase PrsW (M82 family)
MVTLLITILPSLLIVTFFVMSDRFREPNKEILKVFVYGIILVFPAFYLNSALDAIFASRSISENLIRSFLTAAPVEEVLKFCVLYSLVYKMKDFNEPVDGIVYGVSVSLGFATLENIYYVYFLSDYFDSSARTLAIVRSFSAVPAHGVFGAVMGYFFMKYSFVKKQNNLFLCMFVPFLLHGFYNFFAADYFIVSFLLIVISWIVVLRMFSRLKKSQKTKKREYEKKV